MRILVNTNFPYRDGIIRSRLNTLGFESVQVFDREFEKHYRETVGFFISDSFVNIQFIKNVRYGETKFNRFSPVTIFSDDSPKFLSGRIGVSVIPPEIRGVLK